MTTTQPARIDLNSASYAQFPAPASLPKGARQHIEAFLALRDRRADATTAYIEACTTV